MPDALAGVRVERNQRVREQVVAEAIGAVEVGRRRTGRHVDDAASARRPPSRASCWRRRCTPRPASARSRSRARPDAGWCGTTTSTRPCARRRRARRLATSAALRRRGRRRSSGPCRSRRATSAGRPASRDRARGSRGDRCGRRCRSVSTALPSRDRAHRRSCPPPRRRAARRRSRQYISPRFGPVLLHPGVERPEMRAGRGVDREDLLRGRVAEQHVANDQRLRLQRAGLAGVVGPRQLELLDVAAIDLLQRRVADLLRAAAVAPDRRRRRSLGGDGEARVTRMAAARPVGAMRSWAWGLFCNELPTLQLPTPKVRLSEEVPLGVGSWELGVTPRAARSSGRPASPGGRAPASRRARPWRSRRPRWRRSSDRGR